MRIIERPEVFLVAVPQINWAEIRRYLKAVGGESWYDRVQAGYGDDSHGRDGERLVEFGGRLCYRSWAPGLNANVSRVREDSAEYLGNILESHHGSVIEHANYSFVFHNVSRVFTHELVRHRAGAAYCLSGDTRVQIITAGFGERGGRTDRDRCMLQHVPIKDLYERWHFGAVDVRGRRRRLPSSRQRRVRVLNETTQLFETAQILDVMESGIKVLDRIVLADGKQLDCTGDHAIYTSNGWVKTKDLQEGDLVAVTGRRNALPSNRGFTPRLRSAIGMWTVAQRNDLILPVDSCYRCGSVFSRDELELDHIVPVIQNLARSLDVTNLAPICQPCHQVKTGIEQPDRLIVAGSKFVKVKSITRNFSEEMTYDLSVEGPWNNFMANGIVVHNSQESMRFVRLTDIPMWFPEWAREDKELMERSVTLLNAMEDHQTWMAEHFGLDDSGVPFSVKKAKTSFMRRFAPDGVSTGVLCTMNIRALRHVIYMRTALGAEEEIRLVFDEVAKICQERFPDLMQDYDPNENREWIPEWIKV